MAKPVYTGFRVEQTEEQERRAVVAAEGRMEQMDQDVDTALRAVVNLTGVPPKHIETMWWPLREGSAGVCVRPWFWVK